MFAVETIRHLEELENLAPEWSELCLSDPQATPFQTPEWALAWWRHLGSGRLHCVAIRHGGKLVGLAPLYLSRRQFPPLRRLAMLGTGKSDYLDLIVAPSTTPEPAKAGFALSQGRLPVETAATATLIAERAHPYSRDISTRIEQELWSSHAEWDYLDLQQLRPGSNALGLSQIDSAIVSEHPHSTCPYLPLTGSDGMQGVPTRLRKNLRYSHRRLSEKGEVCFRVTTDSTLDRDIESVFRVHRSRWRSRGLPGVFSGRNVQAFHREAACAFLKRGYLRLHVLELNREIVSTALCYVMNGRAFYYGGGFDPKWAAYSPGSLIVGEAIRSAAAEGCVEFDFLRGEEAYKRLWGCRTRRNQRLIAASNRVGRIAHRLPAIEATLERQGLRLLERYLRRGR